MRFCSHFCSFSFQSQPQRRDQEEAVAAVAVHLATAVDAHHQDLASAVEVHRQVQATAVDVPILVEDLQIIHSVRHPLVHQDHTAALQADLTTVHQVRLVHAAIHTRHLVQRLHVRQFALLLLHQHRKQLLHHVRATKLLHVQYALRDHVCMRHLANLRSLTHITQQVFLESVLQESLALLTEQSIETESQNVMDTYTIHT